MFYCENLKYLLQCLLFQIKITVHIDLKYKITWKTNSPFQFYSMRIEQFHFRWSQFIQNTKTWIQISLSIKIWMSIIISIITFPNLATYTQFPTMHTISNNQNSFQFKRLSLFPSISHLTIINKINFLVLDNIYSPICKGKFCPKKNII